MVVDLSSPDGPGGHPPRAYGEEPPGRDPHAGELVDLMARSARGDHGAFAELYDQLAGPIFGTVFRVLRSRAHAEEVTQEILLEIWRKAASYSGCCVPPSMPKR